MFCLNRGKPSLKCKDLNRTLSFLCCFNVVIFEENFPSFELRLMAIYNATKPLKIRYFNKNFINVLISVNFFSAMIKWSDKNNTSRRYMADIADMAQSTIQSIIK